VFPKLLIPVWLG